MKKGKTNGQTIGFLGLGNMGLPIARNLLNAGYRLRVFNRTQEKGAPLAEQGAELVESPNEVAEKGGVVFSMLADDDAVQSISVKDTDFLRRLGPGGIHVSMSTISPETARQLAEQHSEHGFGQEFCHLFTANTVLFRESEGFSHTLDCGDNIEIEG